MILDLKLPLKMAVQTRRTAELVHSPLMKEILPEAEHLEADPDHLDLSPVQMHRVRSQARILPDRPQEKVTVSHPVRVLTVPAKNSRAKLKMAAQKGSEDSDHK